jgi:hypothetical protein
MGTSPGRRQRRMDERYKNKMIKKIHQETIERFKGMTDEQIQQEMEQFKINYEKMIQEQQVQNEI